MKKTIIRLAAVAVLLFGSNSIQAQSLLGSLKNVLSGTEDVASGLASIFSSSKQATADNIVGTWVYESPAIVFQSDDLLSKAGTAIASKKLETKLQKTLTKYGIAPGNFTITFKSDGTFSETIKGKTYSGKWTVKDSKLVLTYALKSMTITTQKDGNNLLFVTDATKLLTLLQTLGAKTATSSSLSTITSLAKNIKGMQVGITLVKK